MDAMPTATLQFYLEVEKDFSLLQLNRGKYGNCVSHAVNKYSAQKKNRM